MSDKDLSKSKQYLCIGWQRFVYSSFRKYDEAVTNYDKALAVEPSAMDTSDAISIVLDALNRTT